MLYTIDLRGDWVSYRLQRDGSWRRCANPSELSATDFTTASSTEASSRMVLDRGETITLEGTTYVVEPRTWTYSTENRPVTYASLVFRREYPVSPKRSQLVSTIAAGDDSEMNTLVLSVNGNFDLRQTFSCPLRGSHDPSVVMWREAYVSDGHWVGIDASKDDAFIDDEFRTAMECWLEHLQHHETHRYVDMYSGSLQHIETALDEVERNWHPAY